MSTANVRSQLDKRLRDTFREIIDGKNVKRSKHDLMFAGIDVSNVFIDEMDKKNYLPTTVADVPCEYGERVPAFYLEEGEAFFGWVFWENFTQRRLRKLFGSVVKDEKGEWAIHIPEGSLKIIYANKALKLEMDVDHPFEL
ncbi:MAG TPA: hypothetical protein VMM58_03275 [Bacteroidota bacterium]|nr:hypothetical protein [Bacteroidota bacterium]